MGAYDFTPPTEEEIAALIGPAPPKVAPQAPEAFQPNLFARLLEGLSAGPKLDQAPRGFGQGLASGLYGSLSAQGARIATGRERFEARQIERRKRFDEERRKATEDYNKRKAETIGELAKEQRAEKRTTEGQSVMVTPDIVKRYPATAPMLGQSVPERTLKYYTEETPGEKAATRKAEKDAAAAGDVSLGLSGPGLDMAAYMYRTTAQLPALGMGKSAAGDRRKIIERAASLPANFVPDVNLPLNKASFGAASGSLAALTKNYNAVKSFEATAVKNSNMLLEIAKKVPDTGVPLANRFVRPLLRGLGSRSVANFNAAIQPVQAEFARILSSPTLAGQLTDTARREMESVIGGDFTYGQLVGALNVYKRDARNRTESAKAEIDAIQTGIGGGQPRVPGVGADIVWTRDANGRPVVGGR